MAKDRATFAIRFILGMVMIAFSCGCASSRTSSKMNWNPQHAIDNVSDRVTEFPNDVVHAVNPSPQWWQAHPKISQAADTAGVGLWAVVLWTAHAVASLGV